MPRGLGPAARAVARGRVVEVVAGDRVLVGSISVTVVPARHWVTPGAPRAQPIGYLVEDGIRVYFAGDTDRSRR